MGSNIDDELLALAGGDTLSADEENAPSPPASSRRRASAKASSSAAAKGKKGKSSRHLTDDDDDDDADENDDDDADGSVDDDAHGDEESGPLYPIEGIYKSWEEKSRIEDLPLIERESIIAQRRDELLSRERAAQLAGMVAAQQGRNRASKRSSSAVRSKPSKRRKAAKAESDMDEDSDDDADGDDDEEEEDESDDYGRATTSKSRSGRVRKSVGTSDTRNKKLQELSENRRKKAFRSALRSGKSSDEDGASPRKASRGGKRSSSDSEAETEDSDEYVDSEDEAERRRNLRGAASAGGRAGRTRTRDQGPFVAPELEDINKARIGRDDILKIMYRKGWEDMLVGKFVRVAAEPKRDERTGQMMPRYRAHEVVDWKHGPKWYQVDTGKYTRVLLVLAFAKEKHQKQISFVSNADVTPDEHQRYTWQAQESPSRPSKSDVLYQAEEWSDFANEPWTEEIFTEVLRERKAAKAAAEADGAGGPFSANGETKSRGQSGVSTPNATGAGHANGTSTPTGGSSQKTENELLAELNERNRKLDRVRIQEAEKRQAEARRAAALAAAAAASRKEDSTVNGQSSVGDAAPPSGNGHANGGSSNGGGGVDKGSLVPNPSIKAESSSIDVDIDLGDF